MKKILATILAAALGLGAWGATGYNGETVPTGPDMSGTVINVTAANAQYTLDGAYGSINGKTINFTENVPYTLDLARPTKFEGSGTTGSGSGTAPYSRTLNNVTFTSESGVTLAGFYCHPGHIHGDNDYTKYNYVDDRTVTSVNDGYYRNSVLTGITFSGLTINGTTDKTIDVIGSQENLTISGITFTGCTITNNTNGAVYFNNNGNLEYGAVSFENCNIYGYKVGIYINGVGNAAITVANNYIVAGSSNNNAIQITKKTADGTGSVSVTGNFLKSDKYAVNLNNFEGGQITFTGNAVVAGSRGHLGHFKGDASGNFWAPQGATPDADGKMTTTMTEPIADTAADPSENAITSSSSLDAVVVNGNTSGEQVITTGSSDPVVISVPTTNMFGAVKITANIASNLYVAVPFEGFEANGALRKASNVVHAANLSNGAKMFAYDRTADSGNGAYNVYEIDGGNWTTPSKVMVTADGKAVLETADLGYGVAAGTGVILERKNTAETVYVYGQVPMSLAESVTFAAGQTLISPPYTNATVTVGGVKYVDMNAFEWTGVAPAKNNRLRTTGADYIQFRDQNNNQIRYFYLEDGGWGLAPTQAKRYPDYVAGGKALVPVGTAFWYWSKSGGAKVTW